MIKMYKKGVSKIRADFDGTTYVDVEEYGETRDFPRDFREVTLTTFLDDFGQGRLAISFNCSDDNNKVTLFFNLNDFFKELAKSIAKADNLRGD